MEITRLNFIETLPIITEAIEDSSFIAIDAEFTGLTSRRRENALDTCDERYLKLINGTKDFMIVQFGVCTFNWDEEQQQYIAKPFNFFTFPRPYNRQMPDIKFLCQSSSLEFLANQGFDFNKWVCHGIPFLLPVNEDKLRQMVASRSSQSNDSTETEPMPIPPAFEKTIEVIMNKVEAFIADSEQKALSLPPSSPLVRRLVYSHVNAAHKTCLHLESKTNEEKEKYVKMTKCSGEEKKALERQKIDKENVEVEEAVGFSKIIRLLSQSGKLVLGHNMLLDLLHTIRLFVSPLPATLDGFKALAKGVLPRLIDTKVMASTEPLQSLFHLSHLEEVYKTCCKAPFAMPHVLFSEGFDQYAGDIEGSKSHEAGYDAYMTGIAFLAMASYLEKQRDGSSPCGEVDVEIIKPFMNKIFLYPRMEDIPYLNISGEDLVPSRDHVFYVEHPSEWQFTDIQKLFKDFGFVYITKINEMSAFVSVAKRERATKVLQKLQKNNRPYRIQSYSVYHSNGKKDNTYQVNHHEPSTSSQDANTNEQEHCITPCDTPDGPSFKRSTRGESDVEDGEIPDSPEPLKKKLKGEHTYFDEPEDW